MRTNVRYTSYMENLNSTYKVSTQKIKDFYKRNKRMPSYSEASKLLGFKSKSGVFAFLQKLIDLDFLQKSDSGLLVRGSKFSEVKILGLVEAGFPTMTEENLLDSVTLEDYLVDDKEATFMLKVKGDSMYDAGIRDGDMVLVERTDSPKIGQIVIAEIDGEWTMKYLRKDKNSLYLEPANKTFKPIYPKEELQIRAVVTAVIRKYNK
jgi:SOS regulatory protein LexA